jgi:hypothetical protein
MEQNMNDTNEPTYALTHCLRMRGIGTKPADMNRALHAAGVLQKASRASGKDPNKVKPFWRVGEAAEGFAIAVENELSPEPVIQYRDDRFDALLDFLRPTIEAMVREGELKPIIRDDARGAEYRSAYDAEQSARAEAAEQGAAF